MNEIKIFESKEFGEIRTIMIDGEPWFVGKDVAVALGYSETNAMTRRLDAEDFISDKLAGMNMKSILINESGLYSAIFGSKLESAKIFKHWVTSEVLPAIRKTGSYIEHSGVLTDHPGEVANLIKVLSKLMERQGSAPYKVTENAKLICEQYGIQLPKDFIRVPEYEQMKLEAMK